MTPLERVILRQVLASPDYAGRVLPRFESSWFESETASLLFDLMKEHHATTGTAPELPLLTLAVTRLSDKHQLNQRLQEMLERAVDELKSTQPLTSDETIERETTDFLNRQVLVRIVRENIGGNVDLGKVRAAIDDAESFTKTTKAHGHRVFRDIRLWHQQFHAEQTNKLTFDLPFLNDWTDGGIAGGTLNVLVAPSNAGKSIFLGHLAASCIRQNKNVVFFSLEMNERRLAHRIQANIMNRDMRDVKGMTEDELADRMMRQLQNRGATADIHIQHYAPMMGHTGDFRSVIKSLDFTPDVIIVDYLGVCGSERLSLHAKNTQRDLYFKSVAEELRALAVETGLPVFTAAQLNRDGYEKKKRTGVMDNLKHGDGHDEPTFDPHPDLTNIGQSIGIVETTDFMLSMLRTKDMDRRGVVSFKALKNRDADRATEAIEVPLNRDRMRFGEFPTGVTPVAGRMPWQHRGASVSVATTVAASPVAATPSADPDVDEYVAAFLKNAFGEGSVH